MPITEVEVTEITSEDLAEWLHHKVTQRYFKGIQEIIKEQGLNLMGGIVLTDDADTTAMAYAKCVGFLDGLKTALNVELTKE